ncbi:MAG TPA: hypothetical protein VFW98_03335, partial [Gemmatimonadaceae bacterium]|nr:hypothetical protein [Gemmatimonadaceae bacterium]
GDFFRTVENVTGQDLAWFWRAFFYSTDVLDIGIDSVVTRVAGDTSAADSARGAKAAAVPDTGQLVATIALTKHTAVPFPVELRLQLANGSTQNLDLPVDIWYQGDHYSTQIAVKAKVTGARLWPDPTVPDFQPNNDTWGNPPPADPLKPATTGGLTTPIARHR